MLQFLSCLLKWRDLLAPAALKHLVFTCLVNRYILIGLASVMTVATEGTDNSLPVWEAVTDRLKAIAVNLPSDWLTDPEDPELSQLRRFTSQLIERVKPGDGSSGVEIKEQTEMRYTTFKLPSDYSKLVCHSSASCFLDPY